MRIRAAWNNEVDEAVVRPLVQAMNAQGLEVQRADAGVGGSGRTGKSEHDQDGRSGESDAFVAFITQAFQDSHECRRAFNRAMQQDRPFVAVLLESFPATPAMQMQLASVQAIRGYEYDDPNALARDIAQGVRARRPDSPEDDRVGESDADVSASRYVPSPEQASAQAPTQPQASRIAEEPSKAFDKRPGNSRSRWVAAAAIVAAIAIAIVAYFGTGSGVPGWLGSPISGADYTLSAARPALSADDCVDCRLTVNDDATIDDFRTALEMLKGRLDIFAGKGKYDLAVKGDAALLAMPASCLNGNSARSVLRCFLVRPMALSLYEFGAQDAKSKAIPLARSDIESVSIVDDISDASPLPKKVASNPSGFKALKIVLNPGFVSENGEAIAAMGENLVLGQDIRYETSYFWITAVSDDGGSIYAFAEDPRPEELELLAYNYEHDPLPLSFSFHLNPAIEAEWEAVEGNAEAGAQQVSRDDLSGEVATLVYGKTSTYGGAPTEGELLDWCDAMKERFDALGYPYALGVLEREDSSDDSVSEVVIATQNRSFAESELYAVGYGSSECLKLVSGKNIVSLYSYSASAVLLERGEEGTAQLRIDLGKMKAQRHRADLLGKFAEATSVGDTVFFVIGETNVCSGTYAGKVDGAYVFTDLKSSTGVAVEDEGGRWVESVLSTHLKTMELVPSSVQLRDWDITDAGRLTFDSDPEMVPDPMDKEIGRRIKEIAPDCDVVDKGKRLYVSLSLPVDENLAEDGLRIAKELYEGISFYSPVWTSLCVYFIDEDDDPFERARVFMDWDLAGIDSIEVTPRFHGIVSGGRVEAYRDDFDRAFESDPFWAEHKTEMQYSGSEKVYGGE